MPASDWNDLAPETITHNAATGFDEYGKATYSATTNTYRGRVTYKSKLIHSGAVKDQIMSSGFVTILSTPTITLNDKIILPDGKIPVLHAIERYTDEDGPHHIRIYFV